MFKMSRTIGIDAAHRVPDHASKCKNLHGHRYTIEAHCESRTVIDDGEQTGMVFDFGFMKDIMMKYIDGRCDHGTILYMDDPLLDMFRPDHTDLVAIRHDAAKYGWCSITHQVAGKLYIVPFVPTAENLAKHWFDLMVKPVYELSKGNATLAAVVVHETPNGYVEYRP